MIGPVLYIADDHPVITESLATFFKNHFQIVKTFENGQDLKMAILKSQPSHLIIDINMPLVTGINILEFIQKEHLTISSVIFSMYNSNSLIRKCKKLGAMGYILKTSPNKEIFDAFKSDDFYLGSGLTLIENTPYKQKELTPREEEVLRLLVKDYNSKQVADLLFISEFTVTTHRRNLKRKLGVDNTAGLIKYAFENGLVTI